MRTRSTHGAPPGGEYDPFEDSGDSDSTDSDSSGTERLPGYSISSTISPPDSLLPEDDPMDGTTVCPRPGDDAGPGQSLQTSKPGESSSAGECVSEEGVAYDNVSTKAEETEEKDNNDKATEKSMGPAEYEGSGHDFGSSENQKNESTSSSISVVKGRALQMNMHATNASSMEMGKTIWVAGEGSTALASDHSQTVYGKKEKRNEKSESGAYSPNIDSSASSSSGSPNTSEIRKPYVSTDDSTQRQLREARKILENNPAETVGERNVLLADGNDVENPATHMKSKEESNKNDDEVSYDRLKQQESSDMSLTADLEQDVSKVSKFRQKLGRAVREGLPRRASIISDNGVTTSENTSSSSRQPPATATANEETSTEENIQFIEVEKIHAQSNIAQQLDDAGTSRRPPRNPLAAKESSQAVPSCEAVKANLEKTAGSELVRVSRFQAKLLETKKKGEFPAVTKKVNLVTSVTTQNVPAPSRLPTSLSNDTRQAESSIEKKILQPNEGTLSLNISSMTLSDSQPIHRLSGPPVDQISYSRAENSQKNIVTQPLHVETNVRGNPQVRSESTIETKMDTGHAGVIFDTGVRQRLKNLKLQKIYEDDLKVLTEYCNGWFEAKSNLPIERVPQESIDNAGRAFRALKGYVDKVECVFNEHVCLPQGQLSQQVSPFHHGISKIAPPVFREIIESRVHEFANGYEKRNTEIIKQEDEVIKALIGTAGDYFEEEAACLMKNDYFEAQPLSALFSPVEKLTKQSFLHASDIKFPTWQKKYLEMLDTEVQRRKNKIQSDNERQRLKTQKEIDVTVDRIVSRYTQDIEERMKYSYGYRSQQEKLTQAHRTVKEKMMKGIDAEFVRRWHSCPGLHESAKKTMEKKMEVLYKNECEKLVPKNVPQNDPKHSSRRDAASQQDYNNGQKRSGNSSGKGASKQPAFSDLPSLTVAIHLGLSRTRIGLFKRGTAEFVNIAEVENCFYYQDDSILLAYNDSDKQKLNPQGLNFEGIMMQGPIDQIHDVDVGGKCMKLRKEHIISYLLAVLKGKAEVELEVRLPKCVIVVPQFLNECQRCCIRDASRIAGFTDVDLIDDTVAIALYHMMKKKELEVIVTCVVDGVIDVAIFRIKDGILRRLAVSGTHFLSAQEGRSTVRRLATAVWSYVTMSTEQTEDILGKIFNNNELNVGKDRFEKTLKLFTGDAEMIRKIKTVMKDVPNFLDVSEIDALGGGAIFAALCEPNQRCPFYSCWNSMKPLAWTNNRHSVEFKAEILRADVREKKRSSNFPEGEPMTVKDFDTEKKEGYLQPLRQVHGMVLRAITGLRAIDGALKQQQLKSSAAVEVLTQQLESFRSELREPNLRLEEAKKIHDELVGIWFENVQGRSGSQ